jgi:hypothetical protein
VDKEKLRGPRMPGLNLSFAFGTKKDSPTWVKQGRLDTHSDAVSCHLAIEVDRHISECRSGDPLAGTSLD